MLHFATRFEAYYVLIWFNKDMLCSPWLSIHTEHGHVADTAGEVAAHRAPCKYPPNKENKATLDPFYKAGTETPSRLCLEGYTFLVVKI